MQDVFLQDFWERFLSGFQMKKAELTELRYSWFSLETGGLLRNLGAVLMAPPNVYNLYDQCAFLFGFTLF